MHGCANVAGAQVGVPDAILIGFQFILPGDLFRAPGQSDIRLFAVSREGYATELEYL